MKEVWEEKGHVMTLEREPVNLTIAVINCRLIGSRALHHVVLSTMAEKKEKKKSWTYKELVDATGGGEL